MALRSVILALRSRYTAGVSVAVLLATAGATHATVFLNDLEIRREIIGHDFAGVYADGKPWQELYRADGTLTYNENRRSVDGYWTVEANVFCTLYWGTITGGCWQVRANGANCFEFYAADGRQGSPSATEAQRTWTARGWQKDKAPTCGAPSIS